MFKLSLKSTPKLAGVKGETKQSVVADSGLLEESLSMLVSTVDGARVCFMLPDGNKALVFVLGLFFRLPLGLYE